MAFSIIDYDEFYIHVTDAWRVWFIPKFRWFLEVDEPYITIHWTDLEMGINGRHRQTPAIDYQDIYFGYTQAGSATEVEQILDNYRKSSWTNIIALITPSGLGNVLAVDNDGNGIEIVNIADGTADTSAATVGQVNLRSRVLDSQFNLVSANSTSELVLYAFEIPAGTIDVGDMIEIHMYARKTSGSSTLTVRWYLNSANVVGGAGASQYGAQGTSSNLNFTFAPRIFQSAASAQIGFPATAATLWGNMGGTMGAGTLSNAASIWAQITVQKSTGTDAFEIMAASTILHKKV